MIRIRHSRKPYEELEIQGSNSEYSNLRSAILRFCDSFEAVTEIPARSELDSSPYEESIRCIRLCRTDDPLLISVAKGKLFISGKPAFLRLFAQNLPCQALTPSAMPHHVHFDRIGPEELVSEASLDIVLTSES